MSVAGEGMSGISKVAALLACGAILGFGLCTASVFSERNRGGNLAAASAGFCCVCLAGLVVTGVVAILQSVMRSRR